MSDPKQPPGLPDVVDEAGNSPSWVPWVGLGLLCLGALFIAAREANAHREVAPATATTPDAGGAQPAQAPAK